MTETLRPKVIAFEGLDGAGKTTQIKALVEDLENAGVRVAVASSPGRGRMGVILRKHIGDLDQHRKNSLFTYEIARTQREIPNTVDLVIWDRHLDSVIVSNTDNAKPEVEACAVSIRKPDKVIYLDVPPEVSWAREGINSDHPINQAWISEKHMRYQKLLKEEPGRFEVVDATQPLGIVYNVLLHYMNNEMAPVVEHNKEIYDLLFDTKGVVRFLIEDPAEVKPGVLLPMFMNFKSTWSNTEVRNIFTHKLAEKIGDDYDWVIGLESGGSYYATSVANAINKPVSLLRKTDKEHGDKNFLVGDTPPPGSRIAFIDDVYATGQSGIRAVEKLEVMKCTGTLFTIFSYSNDTEMKKRLGMEGTSLTYFKALRTMALERGTITPEQATLLTEKVDTYRNTVYS
jgi:dTMP kinase